MTSRRDFLWLAAAGGFAASVHAAGARHTIAQTRGGQDRRRSRARRAYLQRCAVRRRYRGSQIPAARCARCVEAGSRCARVRTCMSAARREGAGQRRLPEPERLDACAARRRQASGDGLHPRRRIQHRVGLQPALRRHASVPARRRRRRDRESSLERIRSPVSGQARRRGLCGVGKRGLAGPRARAELGARSRSRIRRRSAARDAVRAVGRRREDRDAARDAGRSRSVSSCGDDERSADHGVRSARRDAARRSVSRCAEDSKVRTSRVCARSMLLPWSQRRARTIRRSSVARCTSGRCSTRSSCRAIPSIRMHRRWARAFR